MHRGAQYVVQENTRIRSGGVDVDCPGCAGFRISRPGSRTTKRSGGELGRADAVLGERREGKKIDTRSISPGQSRAGTERNGPRRNDYRAAGEGKELQG